MYTCPHCLSPTISGWRKSNSALLRPTRCPTYRGKSRISGWGLLVSSLGSEVLLWGGLVVVLLLGNPYALLLIPVSLVLLGSIVNRTFPLVPIGDRMLFNNVLDRPRDDVER